MNERAAAGQQKPANGQLCLNYLSHPRGQVQLAVRGYAAERRTSRAAPAQPHGVFWWWGAGGFVGVPPLWRWAVGLFHS